MSLSALFYPKSIAVVGASQKSGSVGNEIAKNLVTQGYGGKLYGHKIITNLSLIKHGLDLAIIAIMAAFVVDKVKKLVPLGVCAVGNKTLIGEAEAKKIFPNTTAALDGMEFTL